MAGTDIFDGGKGAFANALAAAGSREIFVARTSAFFDEMGLRIVAFEPIERLDDRVLKSVVPAHMLELARVAQETGQVQFDTFYVYEPTQEASDAPDDP